MAISSMYKFNQFVEDVGKILHNLATGGDTIMILLTNTLPNAADTIVDTTTGTCTVKATSNAAEIAAGNGYTKKGLQVTAQQFIQSAGVAKFYGVKTVWTGVTGVMATFRYAVVYNDSKGTTSTRPVIGWFDYGASIAPGVGETFTVGNQNDGTDWTSTWPMFTLT
jgi:hypothetical protein